MQTQTWKGISSIYIGGAICLPVILIGQELCRHYGLVHSLGAILLGNFLLYLLSLVTATIGTRDRRSTPEQAQLFLGPSGGRLFSLAMMVSMLAWFAIQLNMMSLSVLEILPLPPIAANILLGALITWITASGIGALSRMSSLCLPLMVFTLAYAVAQAPAPELPALQTASFSFSGVSLVMATAIAVIVDMPTFFRFARSPRDGRIACAVLFLFALPLIEGLGVYLSASLPSKTILETFQGTGGALWALWVALFLLLAGWTTNNTNLFSATVCAESIPLRLSPKVRTVALGALGTALACLHISDHIEPVLNGLGIAIGSMGGAMITAYLLGSQAYKVNMCSWAIGFAMGLLTLCQAVSLTEIALLDAFLTASTAALAMNKFVNWKESYAAA